MNEPVGSIHFHRQASALGAGRLGICAGVPDAQFDGDLLLLDTTMKHA